MSKSHPPLMQDARPQPRHDVAAQRVTQANQPAPPALLTGSHTRTRGNGGVQAALLLQMQQTYGNRAVQRALQNAPPGNKTASTALYAAMQVLHDPYPPLLGDVDPRYYAAIQALYHAHAGTRDDQNLPATERLRLLDSGLAGLQSAVSVLSSDPSQQRWVESSILAPARQLRNELNYKQGQERVDDGIAHPESVVQDANPRAQAGELRKGITKVVKTGALINEQIQRLGEHILEEDLKALEEAGNHAHISSTVKLGEKGLGVLSQIGNVLMLADSFLTLTDEEFQHKLTHIQNVFGGVASYADLVKATLSITAGAISVMASFTAITARVLKQTDLVGPALGLARGVTSAGLDTGLKVGGRAVEVSLGTVLGLIDIVHGAAVLLDNTATADEKIEGARDIAMGTAGIGIGLRVSTAAGGMASSAVLLTYYLALYAAYLDNSARSGIMGIWKNFALKAMDGTGKHIHSGASRLATVSLLLAGEQNPAQQVALAQIEQEAADQVGAAVDSFLDACQPVPLTRATVGRVGAYPELAIHFAELQSLRGVHTPQQASVAAAAVLEKLTWVHEHAAELQDGSVSVMDELAAFAGGGAAAAPPE